MAANSEMREIERRKLNITEGLILAALVGLATLIFRLNDSVTRLQVATEATNRQIVMLQAQLADVPGLAQRISHNEARIDSVEDQVKELRGMRGLK